LAVCTHYSSEDFNICFGSAPPNSRIRFIYQNVTSPELLNGQIFQWIWLSEGSVSLTVHKRPVQEIQAGVLTYVPNLYKKILIFHSGTAGSSWVAFNPNPFDDEYSAKQFDLKSQEILELPPLDKIQHIVLLTGSATLIHDNTEIEISRTSSVKLTENKSAIIKANALTSIGIFVKK
jgi:hypothetical protein